MEDIGQYTYLFTPAIGTLSGTVDADADWVYVDATLSYSSDLYPYHRGTVPDPETGIYRPGTVYFPFGFEDGMPTLFCRLPNPPYGAHIIYTDDPAAPNAMTELDPANVGLFRDATATVGGKFLHDQVRSDYLEATGGFGGIRRPDDALHPPQTWTTIQDLGANAIRRDYEFQSWGPHPVITSVTPDGGPIWEYNPDPQTLAWDAANVDLQIISRGVYTYIGSRFLPSPGMVIDMNLRWFNGPGFRCGDHTALLLVSVD